LTQFVKPPESGTRRRFYRVSDVVLSHWAETVCPARGPEVGDGTPVAIQMSTKEIPPDDPGPS